MQHYACNRPAVLIVEDEVLLRWTAVTIVEDAGFNVVEAGTGIEAISILEVRDDILVVFTDVEMPGSLDGLLTCPRTFIRWRLESRRVLRGLARVEKHAIGGAGRGCAADRMLR